jgi:molybdopterin biosynthesis enzyme/cell wall assembly regulator SMI1
LQSEEIDIEDAHTRVTAEDIYSIDDVPRWPIAAHAGYALRTCDATRPRPGSPAVLELIDPLSSPRHRVGNPLLDPLPQRQALCVFAHTPLPANADAVVASSADRAPFPARFTQLWLRGAPYSGAGVVARGSDFTRGTLLVAKGRRISPEQQAVLIAAGVRRIKVSKRPRIGILVSSYDRYGPDAPAACWQNPDACGPYIGTLLRNWGYQVPAIEYVSPPREHGVTPSERRDAEKAYRAAVKALEHSYDLILGTGTTTSEGFHGLALNGSPGFYRGYNPLRQLAQSPGSSLSINPGEDRSAPVTEVFNFLDELGRARGSRSVHHFDQAVLINLPGFLSSVAVLMHIAVRRIIDLYEFVETPGPYWELGILANDVQCDKRINLFLWAQIVWGPEGEPLIDPLPVQEPHRIAGLLNAEVIVAIPAASGQIPAGSCVHFLRLDPARQPSLPNRATPSPIPQTFNEHTHPNHPTETKSMQPEKDVSQSWASFDAWLASTPEAIPGGLNPPAADEAIRALEHELGVSLPEDFVSSLKIHNGQAKAHAGDFADGDALLDIAGILEQWAAWRSLVTAGDFDGITSDPDDEVKDDWFNLKWIPFTHNGCGDHLCIDLDPAPGGTVGQVIRVWHDDDRRACLAPSYAAWLQQTIADLVDETSEG